MKRCILSAIAGALGMFLLLLVIANADAVREEVPEEYTHIGYVSAISREDCFVCGEHGEQRKYWGEDNVGIIDLNTFELLYLEINRYDDRGELIEGPAGCMISSIQFNEEARSYVHAYTYPDNAYARVQITGVQYAVARASVQSNLCQMCLDHINGLGFAGQPPAEYAVVSFEDRTVRPLLNSYPWFSSGNYGIDCEFKENGVVELLIHYCPNRYEE